MRELVSTCVDLRRFLVEFKNVPDAARSAFTSMASALARLTTSSKRWVAPGSASPKYRGSVPGSMRRSARSADPGSEAGRARVAALARQPGAFRTRSLDHVEFPYIYLDATYLHVRNKPGKGGQVVSMAVVVATGVTARGDREILGLDVGDSEDEIFWRGFLNSLKQRGLGGGLGGVKLVISDQHAGLVKALSRAFQRVAHQRCRVHFARNLLAHVPKGQVDYVAAAFRMIFAQAKPADIDAAWDKTRDEFAARWPKIGPYMDEAKAEVLAFTAFPREHWRKIWSTNPLERVNKEIKRRGRVVGIFPNPAAVIRLVGAVLIDMHDEWMAGDRR